MDGSQVYELIDRERGYQCARLKVKTTVSLHCDKDYSIANWLIYMERHLEQAKLAIYDLDFPEALSEIRKITALGVAWMEHHDTPPR